MRPALILLAVMGGGYLASQGPVNSALAQRLGHPVAAAIVSFAAGLVALLGLALGLGLRPPPVAELRAVPVHLWVVGGLLGVAYITTNISLVPRLGVATLMGLTIGGQLLTALLIDHWGLLGMPERAATPGRLLGALLLVAGAALLIRR